MKVFQGDCHFDERFWLYLIECFIYSFASFSFYWVVGSPEDLTHFFIYLKADLKYYMLIIGTP